VGEKRTHIKKRSVINRVIDLLNENLEHLGGGLVRYTHGNDESIAELVTAEQGIPVTVSNVRGLREKEFGKIRKQSARKLPPTPVPEPATTDTELRDQVAALQKLVASQVDALESLRDTVATQNKVNLELHRRLRDIERRLPAQLTLA
jgi:hypothetical protein